MASKKNPSVTFDLASEAIVDGRFVVRKAPKIFEAGDFPDKAFSMTVAEVATAANVGNAIPIELEHKRTVLSGKLGEVFKLGSDNGIMFGEAKLPKWLDDLLGPDDRKLSAHFDRTTKQLKEISLVLNPRIEGARLAAAFAADQAYGDGIDTPNNSAMQGPELLTTIHDLVQLARDEADETLYSKAYIKKLDTILAASATDESAGDGTQEAAMSADQNKPNPVPPTPPVPPPTPKPSEPSAAFAAEMETMKAESKSLKEQVEKLRTEKIQAEAAAFAESQPAKIYPAEKAALAKLYARLATADVTFSGNADESAVALLKASIAARPAHNLTEGGGGYRTIPAQFSAEDELKKVAEETSAWAKQRGRVPVNGAA